MPNVVASTSRTSWAKKTNVEKPTIPRPLSRPRMMASERSSGCRHNQRTPSAISLRQSTFSAVGASRARNWPLRSKTSPAASAKLPASKKNGTAKPIPMRMPPSGGPMKLLVTNSAAHRLPLAFSRCSGSTMAGNIVWDALSLSTSANPNSRAERYSNTR
jgi:hypothetical protein